MSANENHSGHPATPSDKVGGCCGGGHEHDCGTPQSKPEGQSQKPAVAGHGPHAHSSHGGGSCGCGGEHK